METSAKDSVKVEAAFMEAAKLALANDDGQEEVFIPETIKLDANAGQGQGGGCC